jgi:nucleoside-diphosphate-sugar epimerase
MSPKPAIESLEGLEENLSRPTASLISFMRQLKGDLIFLGVGGKMGPTMARMAKRADEQAGVNRRIIGVSRFGSGDLRQRLASDGIETIACDLLDESALNQLPKAANVVYMPAMKFGSTGNEPLTWAMNAWLPSVVCQHYPNSRILAFSTGNVYGLTNLNRPSQEEDIPNPVGEYAMSCLGRERMFQHFSKTLGIPAVIVRLNYATELRYGVLVDIAQKVWNGQPVEVGMGHLNAIWQSDANAAILEMLGHTTSPPTALNITGESALRIADLAAGFGQRMQKTVHLRGEENASALLSDSSRAHELFGKPETSTEQMLDWIAAWVMRDGESLGKPTHFESRDGKF